MSTITMRMEDLCTPLYNAARKGHTDVVHNLLDRGAEPNLPNPNPNGTTHTTLNITAIANM